MVNGVAYAVAALRGSGAKRHQPSGFPAGHSRRRSRRHRGPAQAAAVDAGRDARGCGDPRRDDHGRLHGTMVSTVAHLRAGSRFHHERTGVAGHHAGAGAACGTAGGHRAQFRRVQSRPGRRTGTGRCGGCGCQRRARLHAQRRIVRWRDGGAVDVAPAPARAIACRGTYLVGDARGNSLCSLRPAHAFRTHPLGRVRGAGECAVGHPAGFGENGFGAGQHGIRRSAGLPRGRVDPRRQRAFAIARTASAQTCWCRRPQFHSAASRRPSTGCIISCSSLWC